MADGRESTPVLTGPRTAPDALTGGLSVGQQVWTTAVLLVVAQLAFRAWALLGSWFYTDDYRIMAQARRNGLGFDSLMAPFDGHLMPVSRLVSWLIAESGDAPRALAVSSTLGLQVVASLTCLWMLVTLFGTRWAVVGLLALYLTTAVTLPATMWWIASLNALPQQIVIFTGVGCWVTYLRGRRSRWLVATVAVVALGLASYTKAVLVIALLAYLLLAYFVRGRPVPRVREALRREWRATLAVGSMGIGYVVYYLTQVPSVANGGGAGAVAGDLARTMLGRALATGLVGGPWRWDESNPPVGYADPPGWAVVLTWVLLAGVVVALAVTRRRTGRAWGLLALYAAASYALLLLSRAPAIGPVIGAEYRYLTDVQPVAVLCLGLAVLPLRGAVGSSEPRPRPVTRRATRHVRTARSTTPLLAVATAVVCVSGLMSSVLYVRIWHDDNPGERWARAAMDGLDGLGTVAVVDAVVPPEVVPGYSYPYNTTGRLLPLLVDNARFPDEAEDLVALDPTGRPYRAVIGGGVRNLPGTEQGCGWRVTGPAEATIPMDGPLYDYTWWVRIGYLASTDDELTVDLGSRTVTVPVRRGLHNVFVRVTSDVAPTVRLGGLSSGSSVCVDAVEVGNAVAGGPL